MARNSAVRLSFLCNEINRGSNAAPASCSAMCVAIELEPGANQKISMVGLLASWAGRDRFDTFRRRPEGRRRPEPLSHPADFRESGEMNDAIAPDTLALHRALVTL